MTRAIVLISLLVAGAAHADVWQQAIAGGGSDPHRIAYDSKLATGDELVEQANSRGISPGNAERLLDLAVQAYTDAAKAEPREAEPYFRIGHATYSFYFQCSDDYGPRLGTQLCSVDPRMFDRKRARQVIAAWDAAEARAPLDPRFSVLAGNTNLLFERALLHTKLADRADLEGAASDYEKILARTDTEDLSAQPAVLVQVVLGNLAETYMMLDRLDEAIATYRMALRRGGSTSVAYGLAVALDRDGRGFAAHRLIVSQTAESVTTFRRQLMGGVVFFVPFGEQYYYLALLAEAFGHDRQAIVYWRAYIRSGAHPEFQGRAREHIAALLGIPHHKPLPRSISGLLKQGPFL